MSTLTVRTETRGDSEAVHALNVGAFAASELGYNGEAELVDQIRASHGSEIVSLVAELDGGLVGHILFTPAAIDDLVGMALGPMAVAPDKQREGIGSRLVTEGLKELRSRGVPFVVVIGHPQYYPRFGFFRASEQNVACEFEGVPDEAFMLLVLADAFEARTGGVTKHLPEFSNVPLGSNEPSQ